MKTKIIFYILINVVFFMSSCHRCDKSNEFQNLGDDDILVYKINDKLIYKSNINERDTFVLLAKSNYTLFFPYDGVCKDKGIHIQSIEYSFSVKNSNISVHGDSFIINWIGTTFSSDYTNYTIVPEYQFNGSIYKNVYCFNIDSGNNVTISKLIFSKKFGILLMEKTDGAIWEFEQVLTLK